MKLCYRGVEYDYNAPSLEMKESEVTGCYRGRTLHFSYPSHVPVPQPVARYTYRGVGYATTAQGQPQPLSVGVEGEVRQEVRQSVFQGIKGANSPIMQARRHLLMESTLAHRTNMQRSLDHRLAVAKAQGNDHLVQQLQEELHQLA
ncbi:MAG: hypothetical protein RLZZ597_1367 [Cyanobacteriota bacterium]|jgi:hypothetical protein